MTTEVATIKVGDKLRNGGTVVAMKEMARHKAGPVGVVLCFLRDGTDNPEYVTWECRFYDGDCFTGHYFDNVVDAANDFAKRVRWVDDDD